MNIYVASSWRNPHQPWVVKTLQKEGHEVYDFRNTKEDGGAFNWDYIDPNWERWKFYQFTRALTHPLAQEAFDNDMGALRQADVGIMVMPCGASSHLEIGYFVGAGKHCAIYMTEGRPELMYKGVDVLTNEFEDILNWLQTLIY